MEFPCTVFPLNCCYQDTCPHTLCQQGKPPESREVWCEGGPPLSFIPLPMKNEQRPYGWADCQKCPSGKCTAHFLASSQVLKLKQSDNPSAHQPMSIPPSEVIKKAFETHGNHLEETEMERLAADVLLPVHEVN